VRECVLIGVVKLCNNHQVEVCPQLPLVLSAPDADFGPPGRPSGGSGHTSAKTQEPA